MATSPVEVIIFCVVSGHEPFFFCTGNSVTERDTESPRERPCNTTVSVHSSYFLRPSLQGSTIIYLGIHMLRQWVISILDEPVTSYL